MRSEIPSVPRIFIKKTTKLCWARVLCPTAPRVMCCQNKGHLLSLLVPLSAQGQVRYSAPASDWKIFSGEVQQRLSLQRCKQYSLDEAFPFLRINLMISTFPQLYLSKESAGKSSAQCVGQEVACWLNFGHCFSWRGIKSFIQSSFNHNIWLVTQTGSKILSTAVTEILYVVCHFSSRHTNFVRASFKLNSRQKFTLILNQLLLFVFLAFFKLKDTLNVQCYFSRKDADITIKRRQHNFRKYSNRFIWKATDNP